MKTYQDLIDNDSFYYISTNNELCLAEGCVTPYKGMTCYMAKAFWIKDSPNRVWRFKDVYDSREKFSKFLLEALRDGADKNSVKKIALQAGGDSLVKDIENSFKTLCES